MREFVNVEKFKERATLYMKGCSLPILWVYGRKVGLRVATKMKKEEVESVGKGLKRLFCFENSVAIGYNYP